MMFSRSDNSKILVLKFNTENKAKRKTNRRKNNFKKGERERKKQKREKRRRRKPESG